MGKGILVSGRGLKSPSISVANCGRVVQISVDCDLNLDFWLSMTLTVEELRAMLEAAEAEDAVPLELAAA